MNKKGRFEKSFTEEKENYFLKKKKESTKKIKIERKKERKKERGWIKKEDLKNLLRKKKAIIF